MISPRRVCALYQGGMGLHEVAAIAGRSHEWVRQILMREGVPRHAKHVKLSTKKGRRSAA